MTIDKEAKSKLLKLIRFMESLPKTAEKHFSMMDWAVHRGGAFKKHHKLKDGFLQRTAPKGCGTRACAFGWACSVPEFYKAGLRLQVGTGRSNAAVPIYQGEVANAAAEKFFGISDSQVSYLFHAYSVKTPKDWARNARRLIKEWSAPRTTP